MISNAQLLTRFMASSPQIDEIKRAMYAEDADKKAKALTRLKKLKNEREAAVVIAREKFDAAKPKIAEAWQAWQARLAEANSAKGALSRAASMHRHEIAELEALTQAPASE